MRRFLGGRGIRVLVEGERESRYLGEEWVVVGWWRHELA